MDYERMRNPKKRMGEKKVFGKRGIGRARAREEKRENSEMDTK